MSELKATSSGEIRARDALLGYWWYEKSEADKVIAKKDAEISKLKEERRWRKCSEELPSHDTWCIVYHEGQIDVDHYTDDCNSHDRFVMYGFYVTHWMPLPKAPEK